MSKETQIRLSGVVSLVIGLALCAGAAWFYREAAAAIDYVSAVQASTAANGAFALALVFIVICGLEFQRAKNGVRIERLEKTIEALRGGA